MDEENNNFEPPPPEEEGGGEQAGEAVASPPHKTKKKKGKETLRKAPQAPKRFKSSYICFFMAKQPEIKEALGDKATVTEISKRSAEMWKHLSAEDRAYWDDVAAKDKERYMVEKASYTGPWQVPWKRAKKDPSAPKRPMSAFLYYSQGKRTLLKKQHPEMKNTEVSRLLGDMWRNAPESEKRPHIEKEKEEREKYKVRIAEWRKEAEAREKAQKKAEWTAPPPPPTEPPSEDVAAAAGQFSEHYPPHPGAVGQYMFPPPAYPYAAYPAAGAYGFPPAPTNSKQPVVLGANGLPQHYQQAYPDPTYPAGEDGLEAHVPFDYPDPVE